MIYVSNLYAILGVIYKLYFLMEIIENIDVNLGVTLFTPSALKESIPGVKMCPQISRFLEDDGPPAHLILLVFPSYLLFIPSRWPILLQHVNDVTST